MPIIKSAKKRVRTARKAAIRNRRTKRNLRDALKAFSAKPAMQSYGDAQSKLDKAVKRGVIHKNKAARLKKQAAAKAKAAGVKSSKVAKAPKKAAPKTSKSSKPAAKKPAAKK